MEENVIPNIPYMSQLGPGADGIRNACGMASVNMVGEAYKKLNFTIAQLYGFVGISGGNFLSVSDLRNALSKVYGVSSSFYSSSDAGRLVEALIDRKPCIALLSYSTLVDAGLTEFSNFRSSHFVVVKGADITNVYINDPYRANTSGEIGVPVKTFWSAWTNTMYDTGVGGASLGNPPRCVIVPGKAVGNDEMEKPPAAGTKAVVTASVLNIRGGPSTTFPVIGTLRNGSVIYILEEKDGWAKFERGWCSLTWLKK